MTLHQVSEIPEASDNTDLPPLKSAESAQLASGLTSVYKMAVLLPLGPPMSCTRLVWLPTSSTPRTLTFPNGRVSLSSLVMLPDSDPANIAHEWVVYSATEGDNDDQVEEEKEGDGLLTASSFLPTVPRSFLTPLPSVSSMGDDKVPTSGIHAKSHHVQHQ